MTHTCVGELGHYGSSNVWRLFGAESLFEPVPTCVDWTLRNIFQWNLSWKSNAFIQDINSNLSSAEYRPVCFGLNVNSTYASDYRTIPRWFVTYPRPIAGLRSVRFEKKEQKQIVGCWPTPIDAYNAVYSCSMIIVAFSSSIAVAITWHSRNFACSPVHSSQLRPR